jgi:isopenicillin N synthase-like dioxygenase
MSGPPTLSRAALASRRSGHAFDAALREWGAFYLVDHGFESEYLERVLAEIRRFFALPSATKRSLERTAENPWGYFDRELTKNVRDWKEIFDFGPDAGPAHAQWPADLPGFRQSMQAFYRNAHTIALEIVAALESSLEVASGTLLRCFESPTGFLRLNHYPRCDSPAAADSPTVPVRGHLGISHHTDAGAVTVLLQDGKPGLQIEHDRTWRDVTPSAGALLIHLGDVVQVWSNDRYRAPPHRVLASAEHERYSAPYFLNPSYETTYAPLPGACGAEPPRYRSIHWGEFRSKRAAGDYADLGEEVQITHYRIDTARE